MTAEFERVQTPGPPRWGTGPWLLFLCIGGGALVGIGTLLSFLLLGSGTGPNQLNAPIVLVWFGIAIVFGVIVGIPVGIVVMITASISLRLNESRVPGIVAGVLGSCTSLWFLTAAISELLLYFVIVAILASAGLIIAARVMDRREHARVRSLDDVDSSATP